MVIFAQMKPPITNLNLDKLIPPPPATVWKGPLGGLTTNNLTGLKHVSHV